MPLISLLSTGSIHRQRGHQAPSDDGEAELDLRGTRDHRLCSEPGCAGLVIRQRGCSPVRRMAHLAGKKWPQAAPWRIYGARASRLGIRFVDLH